MKRSRSFFLSVRFRLTMWYFIILVGIFFIFGVLVYTTEEKNYIDTFSNNMNVRLAQLASLYNTHDNRLMLDRSIDAKPLLGYEEAVLLLAPEGTVFQSFGSSLKRDLPLVTRQIVQRLARLPITAFGNNDLYQPLALDSPGTELYLLKEPSSFQLQDSTYGVTYAVIVAQQRLKAILIVEAQSDVARQLNNLLHVLGIISLLVLVISGGGGYWLADRAIRPVQKITHLARQISETNLDQRLDFKRQDELGELTTTFNYMLARLEAAFERQQRFTANASHELRTPLTIITMEAEGMLMQLYTPEEQMRATNIILQESKHMALLVNDLLLLARADAQFPILKDEEVDLSEVVVDVVERLEEVAQTHSMLIAISSLPELMITGNRMYLMQLVKNIVENALKYSSGSGTKVEIDMTAQYVSGEKWAVLSIRDDGPGIAQEHLPYLFERFYRVSTTRTHSCDSIHGSDSAGEKVSGSGLGLSIAQWIAHTHRGEIRVHSEPGHGATFEIWLPISSNLPPKNTSKSDTPDFYG